MSSPREEIPPTVLIVEDDLLLLWSLRLVFINSGYHTVSTESAEEAIELLSSVNPEVVLADSALPRLGMIQLLSAIRKCSPGLPIIVLGGDEIPQSMTKDKNWNLNFCEKPVDFNELVTLAKDLGGKFVKEYK